MPTLRRDADGAGGDRPDDHDGDDRLQSHQELRPVAHRLAGKLVFEKPPALGEFLAVDDLFV